MAQNPVRTKRTPSTFRSNKDIVHVLLCRSRTFEHCAQRERNEAQKQASSFDIAEAMTSSLSVSPVADVGTFFVDPIGGDGSRVGMMSIGAPNNVHEGTFYSTF